MVEEVTDDKSLPKMERKRLQIERAAGCSRRAKLVKLADKLHNLRDLNRCTPQGAGPGARGARRQCSGTGHGPRRSRPAARLVPMAVPRDRGAALGRGGSGGRRGRCVCSCLRGTGTGSAGDPSVARPEVTSRVSPQGGRRSACRSTSGGRRAWCRGCAGAARPWRRRCSACSRRAACPRDRAAPASANKRAHRSASLLCHGIARFRRRRVPSAPRPRTDVPVAPRPPPWPSPGGATCPSRRTSAS